MSTNSAASRSWPLNTTYLMRGQLGASLRKHLFGMRHYIETGKTVSMEDYDEVHRRYARVEEAAA